MIFSLRETSGWASLRMISASVWPMDVLHRDERLAVLLADVEDRDDVGVAEAGDGTGLAVEALAELLHILPQQLDRDLALENRVPGEIQRAHPAASDAVDDHENDQWWQAIGSQA